MAGTHLIDHYLEQAKGEIPVRAQWAADTYNKYSLTSDTAIIAGTRALDMHGIDGRLPGVADYDLDLDVIATSSELARLRRAFPPKYDEDNPDFFERESPNVHTIDEDPRLDAVEYVYGLDGRTDFESSYPQSEVVTILGRTGLYRVLKPYTAAKAKFMGGSHKDILGTVSGYVSGYNNGLEIVRTMPEWHQMARLALDQAVHLPYPPDWINGLASHPAFASVPEAREV